MKGVTLAVAVTVLTGCGAAYAPSPFDDGHVMLAGDAAGIRSFFDGTNGIIANTKTTDPMGRSAHWELRARQEHEITRRGAQGFWQKLVGGSEEPAPKAQQAAVQGS